VNAVANAGPLIALGKLDLIYLLNQLYNPLLVPDAVYEEVVTRGLELGQPDAYAVRMAVARQDLIVIAVETTQDVAMAASLHRGERAVIALARQRRADWVLLDDQLAREQAHQLGLHVKGTLQRRSLLSATEAELVFEAIIQRDDIWINESLVRRVREKWRQEMGPNYKIG
jgi:hypothetical protein